MKELSLLLKLCRANLTLESSTKKVQNRRMCRQLYGRATVLNYDKQTGKGHSPIIGPDGRANNNIVFKCTSFIIKSKHTGHTARILLES